jgi:hypothetical protein
VNLRDTDHANERYDEVVALVNGTKRATRYYTDAEYIEDTITLEGNDWTFAQHKKIETVPTEADFMKVVSEYLAWEVGQVLKGEGPSSNFHDACEAAPAPLQAKKPAGWKQFKAGTLFEIKSNPQLNKESFNFAATGYPYFTRTAFNNGILGYVDYLDDEHKIGGNSLAIGMIEMRFHYMETDFYAGQFTKTAFPKFEGFNKRLALYFTVLFGKYQKIFQGVLIRDFEKIFANAEISLPVTESGEIDFDYMSQRIRELEIKRIHELEMERIRELEAYLKVTGLSNYNLTDEEETFARKLSARGGVKYKEFRLGDLFEHIVQGRRLKKEDHISGDFPFVMSGVTNTGLTAYIANPINRFPADSITIDIFGNTFYRSYEYSASDDVGIYWSDKILSRETLLYISATIGKALAGKYSYSDKLRSSQSLDFKICLPVTALGEPDYGYMSTLIGICQKRVIRNVAAWKDREIAAAKKVAGA